MIKAAFFDVGGTLIYPYPSVGAIYAQVAERHGVSTKPQELNTLFKRVWTEKKERRQLVDKAWWRTIVDAVFQGHSFKNPGAFFDDIYQTFEKKEVWRIYDDVLPTLTALKQKGVRLAVASNWDNRLPRLMKDLQLAGYFERSFVSFELGCVKPDRKFFATMLEQMRVDPLEAIHIGDDPFEDIAGAQNVGMRAYLLDRKKKPRNSRELVDLTEVLDRI